MTDDTQLGAGYSSAKSALEGWIDCVQSRDPEAAASCYGEENLAFWGTMADHRRDTRAQAKDYFDRFLDVDSLKCTVTDVNWRDLDTRVSVATGTYVFEVSKGGESKSVEARFSFVFWQNDGGDWVIADHHSSMFPEGGY